MSASGRVIVLGAINLDLVLEVPRLPAAGETVLGGELRRYPGGKGANQAVAAARAGAAVRLFGAVGDDAGGRELLEHLAEERVDVSAVARARAATGTAFIVVDPHGENQIAVAPGANAHPAPVTLDAAAGQRVVVLASMEVPLAAITAAARSARAAGSTFVLNTAPAHRLSRELLELVDILVANDTEVRVAAGAPTLGVALQHLRDGGVGTVIATRGARGVTVSTADGQWDRPAHRSGEVRDTTGAGDTFCGVLAAWLAGGAGLAEAVRAANVGAGLSVLREGAQGGMPTRGEIIAADTQDG